MKHHVLDEDSRIAVTAELLLARLFGRDLLAGALAARLEACPHPGPAVVSR